jgi:hypothetical protein
MNSLNAEQILESDDCALERVHVPEWNGDVYIRTMSGEQLDTWIRSSDGKNTGDAGVKASFLVGTLCDQLGAPLFEISQLEALNRKSGSAITRLYLKARKLNPISDEDLEAEIKK